MNYYQDIFFRYMDLVRGRNTIKRLKFLRKSQFWSKKTLEEWQLNRLNELLYQAKNHSAYYSHKFSNIKLPLNSLDDIKILPILTKNDIRYNFTDISCTNISKERFVQSQSGGSTGVPTKYFWDKRGMDWNRGTVYRSSEWANVHLGEKTIQMTGSHFDYKEFQKLKWKIVFFLQRYKNLPVSFLSEEIMEKYYQLIKKYKPTSIWGYASGINALASFIKDTHSNTKFPYLKALITSSENLSPSNRNLINSIFGENKVFDHYGSREMYIASECSQHNGYHIHAEVVLLEVVDKDNMPLEKGKLGRILLTDLSNQAFPFIRYEIGDMGILTKDECCECGVTLPKLERIEGRIADMIILPDRVLTPPNFTIIMSDIEGVAEYQIVQKEINVITINVIKGAGFTRSTKEYIVSSISSLVGENIDVVFNIVDKIHIPKSGKRRFIISDISKNYL